jgi:hypothetical protein
MTERKARATAKAIQGSLHSAAQKRAAPVEMTTVYGGAEADSQGMTERKAKAKAKQHSQRQVLQGRRMGWARG